MKIYKSITEIIGKTPLMELTSYEEYNGLDAKIYAKLESFNPTGSVKARTAYAMIVDAEEKGLIKKGAVIIEPTSGNTGIGLACVACARGYKTIFVMPETMSIERQKLLKAYCAEVVLTNGKDGMSGAIKKANELKGSIDGAFIPGQFDNPSNPEIHFSTTGPEIWEDTDGKIDFLIAGVGTGGTLSGAGKFLKSKNQNIKIVAVEPFNSPVISKGQSGSHGLQGIGAGFLPDTLDTDIIDEVIAVKEEDAFEEVKILAQKEGVLAGISSGAALFAAKVIALRPENKDKKIAVILPDTGERYLSTSLFSD